MARAPYSPKLRTQPTHSLALVSAIVCELRICEQLQCAMEETSRSARVSAIPAVPVPPPWDGRSPPYPPAGGGSAPRALWFLTRRAGYLVRRWATPVAAPAQNHPYLLNIARREDKSDAEPGEATFSISNLRLSLPVHRLATGVGAV